MKGGREKERGTDAGKQIEKHRKIMHRETDGEYRPFPMIS